MSDEQIPPGGYWKEHEDVPKELRDKQELTIAIAEHLKQDGLIIIGFDVENRRIMFMATANRPDLSDEINDASEAFKIVANGVMGRKRVVVLPPDDPTEEAKDNEEWMELLDGDGDE